MEKDRIYEDILLSNMNFSHNGVGDKGSNLQMQKMFKSFEKTFE